MVAPIYKLILTPNISKKAWPPQKTTQNDGYVYIINMHVCAADFSLLNLPKGKSLGCSKPATNS
jgi:hypothetical protein